MSAVTSLIGGIQGSSAEHNAGNAQVGGIEDAVRILNEAFNRTNPTIRDAANRSTDSVKEAASNSIAGVTGAADQAASSILGAAGAAGTGVSNAATDANTLLNPYITAGQTAAGSLNGPIDLASDPGYDFRMKEGMKALERSAAARGGAMGGAAAKAVARYSQDYASNEYQNVFNRNMQVANLGAAASTRAGANLTNAAQYAGEMNYAGTNAANSLRTNAALYGANTGLDAARYGAQNDMWATTTMANNDMANAKFAAGSKEDIGNARAAEYIGAAKQWNGALSGIGGAANNMISGAYSGGGGFSFNNMMRYGF